MVPTGGKHTIARKHFDKLKNGCIVGNMGHSSQEIDLVSVNYTVSGMGHTYNCRSHSKTSSGRELADMLTT